MAEAAEWTEEGCWLAVKREAVQPISRCVKPGVTQGAEIDDPSTRVLGQQRQKTHTKTASYYPPRTKFR